jgi:SAM-dependent methyltransferase
VLGNHGGVWSALPAEREQYFARFTTEYLTVRHHEGRGSEDPAYYLALPYRDLSGSLAGQWELRGKTYRYFEARILPGFEQTSPQGLDILDLGAGNGWLSYRLALRGHRPVAIDLLDDPLDGLGAARHYCGALPGEFPRIRAEFDNLPFADAQFDLAVFNASFHYSTDYRKTLQEVRRCLRWPGRVAILDSPIYRHWTQGELMREERARQFESRYGFRSDSVPSMEYLPTDILARLSKEVHIHWEIHRPWYGWRWHSRPLKAFLARRRTPSRFWILSGAWGPR